MCKDINVIISYGNINTKNKSKNYLYKIEEKNIKTRNRLLVFFFLSLAIAFFFV